MEGRVLYHPDEINSNLNVIPTSNARRNLVFLSEYQILYVREVCDANFEANYVCPRSLGEVYPEQDRRARDDVYGDTGGQVSIPARSQSFALLTGESHCASPNHVKFPRRSWVHKC
jgi:hypothetical protein